MSADQDPDAALMLRVKRGDLAAFESLVEKYKQPVLNLIWRTLGDAAEAEDLTQNVFIQAYRSAERYQASAKFSTWLFTIARNLCLNEIRRRSRHPSEPLEASGTDPDGVPARQYEDLRATPPPEALLQEELIHQIQRALSELPENQRTAILLFREQDMSYEEIAAVLGTSLSATKSLIHRGREYLKQKLKPYLRTGLLERVNASTVLRMPEAPDPSGLAAMLWRRATPESASCALSATGWRSVVEVEWADGVEYWNVARAAKAQSTAIQGGMGVLGPRLLSRTAFLCCVAPVRPRDDSDYRLTAIGRGLGHAARRPAARAAQLAFPLLAGRGRRLGCARRVGTSPDWTRRPRTCAPSLLHPDDRDCCFTLRCSSCWGGWRAPCGLLPASRSSSSMFGRRTGDCPRTL